MYIVLINAESIQTEVKASIFAIRIIRAMDRSDMSKLA